MSEGLRLEAQGHFEKALAAFVTERHWDGAVRVAMTLNRHLDAAKFCLQAGRPWDAAVCFQRANAPKECLQALLQVQPNAPRYRDACVHAIRVAQSLHTPLESLSSFFMPFLGRVPATAAEGEALKELADAFAKAGKLRLAQSMFRSVLQFNPKDTEAAERAAELDAEVQRSGSSVNLPAVPAPFSSSSSGVRSASPLPSAPPMSSASGLRAVSPVPSSASGLRTPSPSTPSGLFSGSSKTPPPMSSSASGLLRAFRPKLGDLLVSHGLIEQAKLDKLYRDQPSTRTNESTLVEVLVTAELVKGEELVRVQSESCGIPWVSDDDLVLKSTPEAAKALGQELAERLRVAAYRLHDRQLTVAMQDPRDVAAIDTLRFSTALKIHGVFATASAIRRANGRHFHGEDPNEAAPSWQGKMLDPTTGSLALEPYSDRYTGTREHQFETGEFDRPLDLPPPPPPPAAAVVAPTPTSVMVTPPRAGMKFAGRYQLEALIGEGGSASVFRALDLELGEPVAIKIFQPATTAEADTMVARFKLELSLSRLLTHPNIIRLFDLGSEGPWRYLTMELLEGRDLASLMNERGRALPIDEGLKYLELACLGLQCAHDRGVVHRDVKPHNLFVTTAGDVKVMDFGIARKMAGQGVTVVGTIAGTPEYMSPEQINGTPEVTGATDLYALGVTAYQLFTGALPFNHAELTRLLIAQATEPPPPPRDRNPNIPPILEAVLLKCLEKDPKRRPANAAVLSMTFRAIRDTLVR